MYSQKRLKGNLLYFLSQPGQVNYVMTTEPSNYFIGHELKCGYIFLFIRENRARNDPVTHKMEMIEQQICCF